MDPPLPLGSTVGGFIILGRIFGPLKSGAPSEVAKDPEKQRIR